MAKFMLVKMGLMVEITDADTLREAALKSFDEDDRTSPDHPETADWHASEEGQEARRLIVTEDKKALDEVLDRAMLPLLSDGVPGAKIVTTLTSIEELDGTTRREARDDWSNREGITAWPDFPESAWAD